MKMTINSKILVVLLSFHISGCTVSGCNLIKSHEFTLTFVDAKSNPLPGVTATCSGNGAGSTIANEYNEQKLTSNTKGEILFNRKKTGSFFSYKSVGLFSWNHKESDTKTICIFFLASKEIYKTDILAFQQSRVVELD